MIKWCGSKVGSLNEAGLSGFLPLNHFKQILTAVVTDFGDQIMWQVDNCNRLKFCSQKYHVCALVNIQVTTLALDPIRLL